MNSTGTPQSMLYQMRGQSTAPSDGNGTRNRKVEQQHSYNSGNPMNYMQFLNGQDPSLGRYTPPTLSSRSPTSPQWNNNQGGYAYNLPTSFGGFGGFSQYSQQPQNDMKPPQQGGGFGGGPMQNPATMAPLQGGGTSAAMDGMFNMQGQAKPAVAANQQRPMSSMSGARTQTPGMARGWDTMPSTGVMQNANPQPIGGSIEGPPTNTQGDNNLSFQQLIDMMRTRRPTEGITPIAGEQY